MSAPALQRWVWDVQDQHVRLYVLYLRVGCSNHQPEHLPQPRRRSEMREVTKHKRGRDTREVLQIKTRRIFLVKLAESDA